MLDRQGEGVGALLVASHLAVAGGVYVLTDRRPVDTEVKHTGFFTVETTKVSAVAHLGFKHAHVAHRLTAGTGSSRETGHRWQYRDGRYLLLQ